MIIPMANCKSCGAELVFIRMPSGRSMPCDKELVPYKQDKEGKDRVVTPNGEVIKCRLEFNGWPTGLARIPHWATCPDEKKYKGKGR